MTFHLQFSKTNRSVTLIWKIHHNWRWQLWHGDALGVVSLSKGCMVLRAPRYIGPLLMPGSLGCCGESSFLSQRICYDTDVLWGVNDWSLRPSGLWYRMWIRLVCFCVLVSAYAIDVNLQETKMSTWQNIKILVDVEYLNTSIWWKHILNAGFVFWNSNNMTVTACVYLQSCTVLSAHYLLMVTIEAYLQPSAFCCFTVCFLIPYCLFFLTHQRKKSSGLFWRRSQSFFNEIIDTFILLPSPPSTIYSEWGWDGNNSRRET